MSGALYVGIDGGGTRTTAVATDADGHELARVPGEAGIVNVLEPAARAGSLAALARAAAEQAGGRQIAGLCCGLAGAGREHERAALEDALRATGVAERVRVTTDAEAALADALGPTGAGILVIAGTGSIAWGRDARGKTARAGGWGLLLGDEGSAYALGMAALHAVVRARDGRGQPTSLTAAVLEATGAAAPEGLIAWAAGASKGDLGALAPLVAEAAPAGDLAARAILENAAQELGMHVLALHFRLGPWAEAPLLALAGGLLAPGGPLRTPVIAALERLLVPVRPLERAVDAGAGAAALARALRENR